jgi:putative endonuclease
LDSCLLIQYHEKLQRLILFDPIGSMMTGIILINPWFVYMLECANGLIYTGITNNIPKRFAKHASGKGARFTRINPPVKVLASQPFANRSEASKMELWLKRQGRSAKLEWITSHRHAGTGICVTLTKEVFILKETRGVNKRS